MQIYNNSEAHPNFCNKKKLWVIKKKGNPQQVFCCYILHDISTTFQCLFYDQMQNTDRRRKFAPMASSQRAETVTNMNILVRGMLLDHYVTRETDF
jgi:hypothetical protein